MKKFSGIVAAAITPFQSSGQLDLTRIPLLVEHLLARHVEGFFVCGSTGEFPSMTTAERKAVAQAYVQATAGRVPVIIHVGSNAIHDACDLAAHAAEIGADGISAVPPHYFPLSGVDNILRSVEPIAAAASKLPFYYYHIPGITGVQVDVASLLEQGAGIPNLAGAKYSASNLHEYLAANLVNPSRYSLFFGTDEMFLGALAMGSTGFVGSTYNMINSQYLLVRKHFQAGDHAQALACHQRIVQFLRIVLDLGGLASLKAMMELQGCPCGPVRLPLQPLSSEALSRLRHALEAFEFAR